MKDGKDLSVIELIKRRTSIRTYNGQQLPIDISEKMATYLNDVNGPFDVPVRFMLVQKEPKDSSLKLGTYGVIKDAPSFILAAVKTQDMYLEQLGYEFEKVILYATSLGLGTCWLGGTFRKGEFSKAVGLKDDESLPIISPVGYPEGSRGLVDRMMRFAAGSYNRREWDSLFFNENFSKNLSLREASQYAVPLEMVRLGPSASNKQPWRILRKDGGFHFYLNHSRGYAKALGFNIQRIDMGIAMCHFELSSNELGIEGCWASNKPKVDNIPESAEYIISWIPR